MLCTYTTPPFLFRSRRSFVLFFTIIFYGDPLPGLQTRPHLNEFTQLRDGACPLGMSSTFPFLTTSLHSPNFRSGLFVFSFVCYFLSINYFFGLLFCYDQCSFWPSPCLFLGDTIFIPRFGSPEMELSSFF